MMQRNHVTGRNHVTARDIAIRTHTRVRAHVSLGVRYAATRGYVVTFLRHWRDELQLGSLPGRWLGGAMEPRDSSVGSKIGIKGEALSLARPLAKLTP